MRFLFIYLFSMFVCINHVYAEEEKKVIPPDRNWEDTNDRDNSSPDKNGKQMFYDFKN